MRAPLQANTFQAADGLPALGALLDLWDGVRLSAYLAAMYPGLVVDGGVGAYTAQGSIAADLTTVSPRLLALHEQLCVLYKVRTLARRRATGGSGARLLMLPAYAPPPPPVFSQRCRCSAPRIPPARPQRSARTRRRR